MAPIYVTIKNKPNILPNEKWFDTAKPTNNGPKIPPIRPTVAAKPVPVAGMESGYCSGV
jgi:hypothetical protein